MNFLQIDCFLSAVERGSFTAASRHLYISQSAVSQNIHALERDLGFDLFTRTGGQAILTKAGSYLAEQMLTFRREFDACIETARGIAGDDAAPFIIGYTAPLAQGWFSDAVQALSRRQSYLDINVKRRSMAKLVELLRIGRLDAATVLAHEVEGMEDISFRALGAAPGCIYVSKDHRLAAQESITFDDLKGERLIVVGRGEKRPMLTRMALALSELGFDTDKAILTADEESAFTMVDSGLGVFVAGRYCDSYASQFKIASCNLDIGMPAVAYGLAWRSSEPFPQDFYDCARAAVKAAAADKAK